MIKLFIDFDSSIYDSVKAYVDVYNELYQFHKGFKKADWHKLKQWDLKCIAPLVENCNDIFSHEIFFEKLKFINDNTYEILEELNKTYEIIITTIGTPKNLALKAQFLQEKLPFISNYILIKNGKNEMSKALINMENSIFLDDVESNLNSSNANIKICFGKIYPWNENWKGIRCMDWTEFKLFLNNLKIKIKESN